MTILDAALEYAKKGFSVIPVDQKKVPLVKWEPYQKKKADESEIREWFKIFPAANVGIVTGSISNLLVIDCDTPESILKVQEAIPDSLLVPCETTPRGGMHFFFSHAEGFVNRARVAEGIDVRTSGGYIACAPSVNGNGKRWVWVVSLLEVDPPNIINSITSLLLSFSLYRGMTTTQNEYVNISRQVSSNVVMFQEGRRDEDLFHCANCLVKGGMGEQSIKQVLNILAQNCNPPFSVRETEEKIKSAFERAGRKERNLTQEVREWIVSSFGVFLSSELEKCLHLSSRDEQKHISTILKRCVSEGIIERFGSKRGSFRIIDREIEFMDFVNVSKEGAINLTLPLGIHTKTIFFPRNVIIVAGVTGYGKTSLLLNVIRDNGHKFRFKYFASEMSNLALNYKLARFNVPVEQWQKWMDVIPDYQWDYSNIQDKIFPNDMNVIDYLEPEGEKTYNIHDIITKIIKKLDKGMALIATQKRKDSDLSAGGVYSAKAASLYLSLDWGTINIFKNRFREEDSNPKMTRKDFTIEAGQNFVEASDWYDPISNKKEKRYDKFDKD